MARLLFFIENVFTNIFNKFSDGFLTLTWPYWEMILKL